MTGKLIKYEFRSIVKIMGIGWAALLSMALFAGLFDLIAFRQNDMEGFGHLTEIASAITSFLYGSLFVAIIVVTVLIILMRFYRGLLRDEGYLMHTLPVKTWQLITAKGVVAAAVSLISILAATLSVLILMAFDGGIEYFGEFMSELLRTLGKYPAYIAILLEALLLGVCWIAAMIYKAYAALSIGQLAQKHRIALSVGAWIGIGVVFLILMSILGNLSFSSAFSDWLEGILEGMVNDSPLNAIQVGMWILILVEAVQIAIFHVVSEQILRRKLNLE
ncbi:MAG: hypothetical protein SOW80_10460 [Anaerovoracaceae bacterium]|nr:hypothetical protein [Anaerovoracaceae bacterium]